MLTRAGSNYVVVNYNSSSYTSLKMSDNDEHQQPSKVRKTCQDEEEPATASKEATSPAVKEVTVDATSVPAAVTEEEELFSFFEKKDDEQVDVRPETQ